MENLKIDECTATNSTILRLEGPLTIATLFDFQRAVREHGLRNTIIDLSGVPYMDSAGLGAVLAFWAHTQRSADLLAIVGVSERVQVLFDLTKVNSVLPVFSTIGEAECSFQSRAENAKQALA